MITQDQIQQAFDSAPEHIRALVNSDEVFNAFHEIREKHKLHIDHAGNLATTINALILEIVPFTELDALLKEGMSGVDDDTRRKVVQDVNDKIFIPLREKVRMEAEAKTAPVQAPTPVHKPSIRDVELQTTRDPLVPPPVQTAHSTSSEPASKSVIETKLATPVESVPAAVPPPPKPRYHGTDPYREAPE